MTPGILVTRPLPAAQATAQRLAALGHRPVLAPMLTIRRLDAALPPPAAIQAVLVASANALHGWPAPWHAVPLLAVGAETARQAAAQGFATVHNANGDATDLVALAVRLCRPQAGPLLLAHATGQGDALADALARAGFRLQRAAVYQALPAVRLPPAAAADWHAGRIEAALFFSAETARVFATLLQGADRAPAAAVDAIAIGQRAAAALAPLPWRSVRVAANPDQDAMLALLT